MIKPDCDKCIFPIQCRRLCRQYAFDGCPIMYAVENILDKTWARRISDL